MSIITNKTITNDYFQRLVDSKLETIERMMNNEPKKRTSSKNKQRFIGVDGCRPNLPTRSITWDVSREIKNNYRLHPINSHRTRYPNNSTSLGNLNVFHDSCLDKGSSLEKKNNGRHCERAQGSESSHSGELADTESCSVAGAKIHGVSRSSDPEFRADIVSKLKSKAIGNLLLKAKEDMNVKRLNEMKTRPEKVAEKALLMCDLKSYNEFVAELLSSGVFPLAKERSLDLGKDINLETKRFTARKEMENLERMIGRVFGDDFNHHEDYRRTSFLGVRN